MNTILNLIVMLVVAAPSGLFIGGPLSYGIISGAAAAMPAIVGWTIRPGEAEFFVRLVRPIAMFLALPALWMLVQCLPLGVIGLSNPIWASASATLGQPLAGAISIDLGATLISLCRYLSIMAIGLAATAVCVERQRAQRVFSALMAATGLVAVLIVAFHFGKFEILGQLAAKSRMAQALACAALGLIFSTASSIGALQSYELRRSRSGSSLRRLLVNLSASLMTFLACAFALYLYATATLQFAAACGVAIPLSIMVGRRLGVGPLGYVALIGAAFAIATAIGASQSESRSPSLTLAFTAESTDSMPSVTARILADASWMGNGAGTFADSIPIYRDLGDTINEDIAPTAAAAIEAGLGRPWLWLIVAALVTSAAMLMHRSLIRGRDFFYTAAGAGCVLVWLCELFSDPALLGSTTQVIGVAGVGLALAQSKSRALDQNSL